ncbi:Xaa-Pro dipeptidase [Psittacicella melopsittaci]|uniref:Xaa-Pro dipeptidase n=1 Tax=Psittacicella melopsittaci TaxID=2028576 RepID=A0A3A1Y0X2_9GAMM|nr:Xaa-Pro dipeptidase [Psittacicella melopsittaci]RIY31893.1 Xaa-Pro dipeptidase [Psittacicella melopsittaci]
MSLVQLYTKHASRLVDYYKDYLTKNNKSAVWLHYGDHVLYFDDDQEVPFRANPYAVHLINEPKAVGSYIRVSKEGSVTLYNFIDDGFWNVPTTLDFSFFKSSGLVEVVDFYDFSKELEATLSQEAKTAVIIGPNQDKYRELGFDAKDINEKELILDLQDLRLQKTEYEYEMLCQAQYLAIKAHRTIKTAVHSTKLSENQLLGVYLQNAELPYDAQGYASILAFNENAAILHYNKLDFEAPAERRSFLIDAGAVYKGYQADISRTYCLDDNTLFSDLILGVGNIKDEIIGNMRPGVSTATLQELMMRKTAELLIDAQILQNIDVDQAYDLKIPHRFVPHGFGHSLGINTHDVRGRLKTPQVPGLRATHILEVGNVWTIEPGLYFIDQLITELNNDSNIAPHLNNELIEQLRPYGGIRVEDNVMLQEEQLINFTGDLDNL